MVAETFIPPQGWIPPAGAEPVKPGAERVQPKIEGPSFQEVLRLENEKLSGIRFSAHARDRIESRDIPISREDVQRLAEAIDRAGDKGAQDSLILMDSMAFVVNIPNRTVITALGGEERSQHVFTNIDSAVVMG